MCTGIEIALMFAGVSAAQTIAQGEQQNRFAKFRAAVQNQQADRAQQEAAAQAANIRRQRSREAAHLRARLASSGIDPSSGSALLSLETFSGDSELEALAAVNQGEARAFGARANASELLAGGKAAKQQAFLKAGTTAAKKGASLFTGGFG
jgi:hypothetical protein